MMLEDYEVALLQYSELVPRTDDLVVVKLFLEGITFTFQENIKSTNVS